MELENNKTDYIVSLSKVITGMVPEYGSLLGEIIGNIVPNQRIDRIAKYVKQLDERLSSIPVEKINDLLQNEEFIDLIEESFYMSSRVMSDERREYIINIIAKGIESEELEMIQSKQLLKILNELNDVEIIWLRFYLDTTFNGDKEFREKHKDIFDEKKKYSHKNEKEYIDYIVQDSYVEHLERLGLISHQIRMDREKEVPKFNRVTGKSETSYVHITTFGKPLLKQIGLGDEIEIYRKPIPINIR
ncbi:MAG: hypothetical protein C0412_06480 [Flavobacterium sp.]|nr:hypothetical protein [Flavobacterium sp.]